MMGSYGHFFQFETFFCSFQSLFKIEHSWFKNSQNSSFIVDCRSKLFLKMNKLFCQVEWRSTFWPQCLIRSFFPRFPTSATSMQCKCLCNLLQISFALFKYQYYKHRKIQVEITDCWFCIHVQFCCVFLMFHFPLQLFSTVHQCMYQMLTVLYFWNTTADQVNAIFKCLGIFCYGTDFLTTS